MWLRFLTFCILVTLVLIAVLSAIYGRPVINVFFQRCCNDDIENDQTIFANLENNFLRERLVSDGLFSDDDYVEVKEVNITETGEENIDLIGVRTNMNFNSDNETISEKNVRLNEG
ncbi:hypothetical protein PYW08_010217 [Mythimna loreyi]|uniref:Uncharacterized protein n=1 Tax=Mythimna loreyi TaxID=667449 RepID=A0ACC2Q694_9NEOP|nr:hypothetical protein PYW08_010217 [Mythimna loreyi]